MQFPIGATVRIKPQVARKPENHIPQEHHLGGHVVSNPTPYPHPNHTFVKWADGVFGVQTDWLEMA